jgi:sugar phosphate isomerase/epimerase
VGALNSSRVLLSPDEERQREGEALAFWADAADIPYIRVFDGQADSTVDGVAEISRALDAWDEWKMAHGVQCDLLVETHDFLADARNVAALAQLRRGRLNLLWDTCHSWRLSGRSPLDDWADLKPFVKHIHIKDAIQDPSAKNGVQYVLPGAGELPVLELFDRLQADGFSGPVSLEWEKLWHPDLPSLAEALAVGQTRGWWPGSVS